MTRSGPRVAAFVVMFTVLASPGRADLITSPPGNGVSGNGQGVAPFTDVGDTNGNLYQQIYSSAFFAGVGPVQSVSAVAFRPKQGAFGGVIGSTLTVSELVLQLSTTARNADTDFPSGLNGDLATNPGADARTVFRGPVTLTTSRGLFDPGVANFDYFIAFQSAFTYRPGAGNLLLEVEIPAGAVVGSNGRFFPALDSFTDAFPSRDGTASATDADLTDGLSVGSNSTTGAVTQFTTTAVTAVPAPAPAILLGVGGLLVAALRRRLPA